MESVGQRRPGGLEGSGTMHQSRTAIESELPDLGGVTLEQLRALDDPARERSKRRLLRQLDHLDTNHGMSQDSQSCRPRLS